MLVVLSLGSLVFRAHYASFADYAFPSAADLTREQMIEYVTAVAQENPDNIAKLVKLWLAE